MNLRHHPGHRCDGDGALGQQWPVAAPQGGHHSGRHPSLRPHQQLEGGGQEGAVRVRADLREYYSPG